MTHFGVSFVWKMKSLEILWAGILNKPCFHWLVHTDYKWFTVKYDQITAEITTEIATAGAWPGDL